MPVLLVVVLVVVAAVLALLQRFPYTSMLLTIVGILLTSRQAFYAIKPKNLERRRYLNIVASFGWDDNIDPIEFERRCAEAMRLAGWTAQTTKGSGDQGVDVLAERQGTRVVLQCKRYAKPVGNRAVQEAYAAKTHVAAQYAAVVTNSRYTMSARNLAKTTGVLLLHFTDLKRPNRFFGLTDAPSLHLPCNVTEAQISALRTSRLKPFVVFGAAALFAATLIHDLWRSSPGTTVWTATGLPEALTSGARAAGSTKKDEPTPIAQIPIPQPQKTARGVIKPTSGLKSEDHSPQKPPTSAYLSDGNTFCTVASDFDKRSRWRRSGGYNQEPSTPSCTFIFGQPYPMRISVIRRVSKDKTIVRVEEGNLLGRTGYTDAYAN